MSVAPRPDFAAGAEAAVTERPMAEPDPVLLEAMTVLVGPTRLIRVRDAAQMAADHYGDQRATVAWLRRLLVEIAATVKGKPLDPVPVDWWDDLPERVDDLARRAHAVQKRDALADRLGRVEVEKRVADARTEEHARLGALADARVGTAIQHWQALCDELHALVSDLTPGAEGRGE